ncbi:UDP-N-acetylmuramoyl-L-alanyl-D-glutamate--2,6-diaminopimelate ligase [Gordonia hirsuta DSM 44140 = NBRC 16056]|uniref:UDP-N-acetylmuramoyl-L-alanyl-D-glutamate--2,6-diaminopimelate ligase n=1 Tax=Gordonia hirsuta DSM 44140 = NBRC 16056 TaxID=1121927 RepID=L7L529_9ACTN|nr:UDP-N-acetylmuramoyl-L-alanyl-D-glutamate--2,6-diaminopimelate ligase [Gordonia hirsuta DSM 44140 = NBRC 16056]
MAEETGQTLVRPDRPIGTDLTELAVLSGAELIGSDRTVHGVTLRAQDAGPGDLFAALAGSRSHGADFAAEAVERGAVAILTDAQGLTRLRAEAATADVAVLVHDDPRRILGGVSARIYGDPSRQLTLIGITGTSGKTTTAYLTEAALRAAGRTVGLIGTVEVRIDGVRVPSLLTTPEAPDLQRLFAVMLERGVDTVVMEVSSHALALGRVDGTRFAVGGFTNLSQDHLDFHHTMDEYFTAKSALFDAASPVHAAAAVICVDDAWGEQMAQLARGGAERCATVSTTGAADWSITGTVTADAGSQTVVMTGPDGAEHVLTVPLPGAYNVANALLAVALAATAGVPVPTAIAGLGHVAVPGRLEKVDCGQDFLAVVDYAHKPAAVEAVLATLAGQGSGRIAVVLGAGGDRDTEKRPLMGAAAVRGADLVIVTDDNPRSEDPAAIRAAVRGGAEQVPSRQRRAEQVREVGDRRAAIAAAVDWARSGDVVLIAGKGHETGQEIAGHKHPFDDRAVLAEALDAAAGQTAAGDRVLTVFTAGPEATVDQAKALLRTLAAAAADEGVGSTHRAPGTDETVHRRTWAIFGDLAEAGADENARCVAHDLLGRQAVRLAVDQTLAVGQTRAVRALYQGAIMEGSWGEEAGFFTTVADLTARLTAAAGTSAVPRGGDMVLVAGGGDLAASLLTVWDADPALDVRRPTA